MTYIYRLNVAAIILNLSILYSVLKIRNLKTNFLRTFYILLASTTFTSLFDLIACIFQSNPMNYNRSLLFLVKTLYQISYHIVPISYFYCLYFTANNNRRPPAKHSILYNTPFYISMFLIVLNIFIHKVFYFDDKNVYHHGLLCLYLYAEAFSYIIFAVAYFIRKRSNMHLYQVITIVTYGIISFVSVIIQLVFPHVRIINFILSLSALIGYMALENPTKYEDKETKLYNKNAFAIKTKDSIDSGHPFYLLQLKFSSLDYLYDFLGSSSYNDLITNISDYLKSTYNRQNIYKYSNESIVLFLNSDQDTRTAEIVKLQKRFNAPFKCGQTELTIPYSISLLNIPYDATSLEELNNRLDNNLKNNYFNSTNDILDNKESLLESQLKESKIIEILDKAISENEFELYFQPIYSIAKHKFTAAEALVRIKNQDPNTLGPEVFIPIAEKYGMITQIGRIIFTQFCSFLIKNKPWNYGMEYININLSQIQSIQPQYTVEYLQIMQNYKVPTQYVNFEIINPSSELQNQAILENINNMRKYHINFFLDSCGKMSQNIVNLTKFPFLAVKIDKQLVWSTLSNSKSKIILREFISMVKGLGMDVVAEGIETHEQAIEMIKAGANFLQGFYYSEPLPMMEFVQFIR